MLCQLLEWPELASPRRVTTRENSRLRYRLAHLARIARTDRRLLYNKAMSTRLPAEDECLEYACRAAENAQRWVADAKLLRSQSPNHAFAAAVYALEEYVKAVMLPNRYAGYTANERHFMKQLTHHHTKHMASSMFAAFPIQPETLFSTFSVDGSIDGRDFQAHLDSAGKQIESRLRQHLSPDAEALVARIEKWESLRRNGIYCDPVTEPSLPTEEDTQLAFELCDRWGNMSDVGRKEVGSLPEEGLHMLRVFMASAAEAMRQSLDNTEGLS